MKPFGAFSILAFCSLLLAGCWFYSRPVGDPYAGCQKTTYGVAVASTSNTTCPPDNEPPPQQP